MLAYKLAAGLKQILILALQLILPLCSSAGSSSFTKKTMTSYLNTTSRRAFLRLPNPLRVMSLSFHGQSDILIDLIFTLGWIFQNRSLTLIKIFPVEGLQLSKARFGTACWCLQENVFSTFDNKHDDCTSIVAIFFYQYSLFGTIWCKRFWFWSLILVRKDSRRPRSLMWEALRVALKVFL